MIRLGEDGFYPEASLSMGRPTRAQNTPKREKDMTIFYIFFFYLISKAFDDLSLFADDTPYFLQKKKQNKHINSEIQFK